jgi:hypothetical protein
LVRVRLDEPSVKSIGRFGRLRRTRCAIALAEEAQKSDPDLKIHPESGDVGLDLLLVQKQGEAVMQAPDAYIYRAPDRSIRGFVILAKALYANAVTNYWQCSRKGDDLTSAALMSTVREYAARLIKNKPGRGGDSLGAFFHGVLTPASVCIRRRVG